MNIGKLPFIDFPSVGSALNASFGGRVTVPVAPAMYIYSQFQHVSGIPAPEGVQGVSINKLHILDTMLAELARSNEIPKPAFDIQEKTPEKQLNALIAHYQAQVHDSHAENSLNPFQRIAPAAGVAVNVSV